MPDIYGNPLPNESGGNIYRGNQNSGFVNTPAFMGGSGGQGNYGGSGGANPWLQAAMGNTNNPNLDYESYLTGLGFDVESDKVGKYFSSIGQQYGEDVGMARASFGQGMAGLQSQATGQAMQLGGGQGISSASNPGFGRAQYGMQQGLQGIQQQYGQAMQGGLLDFTQQKLGAQRDAQSEIRSIATGLIGQDAAGIGYGDGSGGNNNNNGFPLPPTDLAGWNPPANPTGGGSSRYEFGGNTWVWDGGSWVTEAQYDSDMNDYYDPYD